MSKLFFDFVAIDMNVFGQLVTKPPEECVHIEFLLVWLFENKTCRIVDSRNRITDEYHQKVDDQGMSVWLLKQICGVVV